MSETTPAGTPATPATPAMPADPVTVLAEGAAGLHELFLAYVNAGFTDYQALALVKVFLAEAMRAGYSGGAGPGED